LVVNATTDNFTPGKDPVHILQGAGWAPLGKKRSRLEDIIKMDFQQNGVDWIYVAQDMDKLFVFFKTVMHFRVP